MSQNGFAAATDVGVALTRLADVEPERVLWLWPDRIPIGKLVTLDGDPGLGKSTLAVSMAATVTVGGIWPDGSACEYPGAVLLMSAEDGLADTVRPRFDAAGADVTKVHAIEGVPVVDEDGDRMLRPPTLADVAAIEEAIMRTGARMLVIDVVMAYLPTGTDSHKDQDIRRVLSRLAALADRTGCTVILIRHLNKASGRDPLYRGGGSIGIVGAARAGLLVALDPDDPERRVLASVKSNLGPAPDSLAYRLVGVGDHGAARVQWEGQTAHTARTLLAESHDDGEERTEVVAAIRGYLMDLGGTAPAADVLKHTRAAGLTDSAVKKARSKAGVRTKRLGFGKGASWVWSIDSHIDAIDTGNGETEPMTPMGTYEVPNGAPTDRTPGMTEHVQQSLIEVVEVVESKTENTTYTTSTTDVEGQL